MLQRERNKTICQIHALNNTVAISKISLVYNYKVNQNNGLYLPSKYLSRIQCR